MNIPYDFIILQVSLTFLGGYMWQVADDMKTKAREKDSQAFYAFAFLFLGTSLYIIFTVHLPRLTTPALNVSNE